MASPPNTSRRARAAAKAPISDGDPPPPPGHERDATAGTSEIDALLIAAVDEAARLLDADGAMVYLLDPLTNHLRFAHDAGIRSPRSRRA